MFVGGMGDSFLFIVLKNVILIWGILFFLDVKVILFIFFDRVLDFINGLKILIELLCIVCGRFVMIVFRFKLFVLNWIFICIVKIFIVLGFILIGIFYVFFLFSDGIVVFFLVLILILLIIGFRL